MAFTPEQILEAESQRIDAAFVNRGLPSYMCDAVLRYVLHGIGPGGFLTAALSNNLSEAFARADASNIRMMQEWVMLFYNDLPGGCWGSREKVEAWIAKGGLAGVYKAA